MNLVLFDIDGTLMRSGGAGRASMARAVGALYGRPEAFDGLSFAGAVDPAIVSAALRRAGVEPSPRRIGRVRATYAAELARAMPEAVASGAALACPGVREAIPALQARAELGLLTGNWSVGARIKLQAIDLWAPFASGVLACGDDADDRDALLPLAVRRARRRGARPQRVVLIGDTPSDVAAARAGAAALGPRGPRVWAVAVSTGFATRESLVEAAPDLLLDNLFEQLDQVLALLEPSTSPGRGS